MQLLVSIASLRATSISQRYRRFERVCSQSTTLYARPREGILVCRVSFLSNACAILFNALEIISCFPLLAIDFVYFFRQWECIMFCRRKHGDCFQWRHLRLVHLGLGWKILQVVSHLWLHIRLFWLTKWLLFNSWSPNRKMIKRSHHFHHWSANIVHRSEWNDWSRRTVQRNTSHSEKLEHLKCIWIYLSANHLSHKCAFYAIWRRGTCDTKRWQCPLEPKWPTSHRNLRSSANSYARTEIFILEKMWCSTVLRLWLEWVAHIQLWAEMGSFCACN